MNKKMAVTLKVIYLLLVSNVAIAESIIPCGWGVMNLHEKNPDLIGFSIKQQPDSGNKSYVKAHPYAVAFIFNSGPAHLVYYSPSGQVLGGGWEVIESGHWAGQNLQPVKKLYYECRGSNLSNKPNRVKEGF